MMITLIMLLTCQDILPQKTNYRTEIDTLKTFDNKVLVKCKIFMNENLIEECIAYLYTVIHKIPRFKLTGNLIQKEIEMDSIVRHGTTKKYFENKLIQVAEFVDGKEINAIYYDQNGTEISRQEYLNIYNLRDPCGIITGEYFISGQKKKKKINH
ncbi:MAG: hypothetical protein AB1304_06750 [Bacteroidota bacterium]